MSNAKNQLILPRYRTMEEGQSDRGSAAKEQAVPHYYKVTRECASLAGAGEYEKAANLLDKLICDEPDKYDAYYLLALCLSALGRVGAALGLAKCAVAVAPKNPQALCGLGGILASAESYDESVQRFEEALELAPSLVQALTGVSGSYISRGNPDPGIIAARKGLELEPNNVVLHNNLALLLLEKGEWAEGFSLYRSRRYRPGSPKPKDFGRVPEWDGSASVNRLALYAEQGLGDELMFASCLPEVLASRRVGRVVCEVSPRLLPLFANSFPDVQFYGSHIELMAQNEGLLDAWCSMADLLGLFGWQPNHLPGPAYIHCDEASRLGYVTRLKSIGPGPYVGVAWSGGTPFSLRKLRMAPMDLWMRLVETIKHTGGTPISVQYGNRSAEAEQIGVPNWNSILADMSEQAALVGALDLVISIPQTVVHLAGSMGVPGWVVVSQDPGWMFGRALERSPFYRSISLHRQDPGESWNTVTDRLIHEYKDWLQSGATDTGQRAADSRLRREE